MPGIIPSLFVKSQGEQTVKLSLRLTTAPRKTVVRFTGGCGKMSAEDAEGLYELFCEAFAGYQGAMLYGGTRMIMRDNPEEVFPGITEVVAHIRKDNPESISLGVVPRTGAINILDEGLVVENGSENPFITIVHPDQDVCLMVQVSADCPEVWDAEYSVLLPRQFVCRGFHLAKQLFDVYYKLSMKHHPSSQNIKVAVDAVIFTIKENELCILLIQMKKKPFTDQWAIPGGLVDEQETSKSAAERILFSQTGVKNAYLEQLRTFDNADRDPAGRVISVAHYALLPSADIPLETTDKYQDVRWWPVKDLPQLAYDHKHIVKLATTRLASRIEYTNVAWSLLPKEFTLTELQGVYEVILDRDLDKRNFRKRINDLSLVEPTGSKRSGEAFRPAALYRFKETKLTFI